MIDGFGPSGEANKARGRLAKRKGAAGEREVVKLIVGTMTAVEGKLAQAGIRVTGASSDVKRNSLQSDRGGFDVHGVPLLALEVKRCETLSLNAWWKQANEQAVHGELAVLCYRQSGHAWRVQTWLAGVGHDGERLTWLRADLTIDDFLVYYAKVYERYLRQTA